MSFIRGLVAGLILMLIFGLVGYWISLYGILFLFGGIMGSVEAATLGANDIDSTVYENILAVILFLVTIIGTFGAGIWGLMIGFNIGIKEGLS